MNQRLKSFIVNLPIIGKLYIVIGNVIKLPDLKDRFNEHLNTNETKSNNIEKFFEILAIIVTEKYHL